MKTVSTIAFAALIGASAVTLISARASAGIVCNEEGDCWHAQTVYQYQPSGIPSFRERPDFGALRPS